MCKVKHNLWANLQNDLLLNIAERFNFLLNYLPLRAVCTSWRSSITLPSFVDPDKLNQDYLLSKTSICRIELTTNANAAPDPSKGWLTLIRHTKTGKMQLLHPISGTQIRYSSIPLISSSETRFVPLYEAFKVESVVSPDSIPDLYKVIVPSSATFATKFVAFVAIFFPGILCYWDSRDEIWICFDEPEDVNLRYDDIIEFKGQVYAVDVFGTVFWFNPVSLQLIQYSPLLVNGARGGNAKSLVESCGDLYLVDGYIDRGRHIDFRVYKLDKELGVWLDVKCLGDQIFVVNTDYSFSVSSTEFVGGRGNCIYFGDHGKVQVFRMEDGRVKKLESVPEYSDIFLSPDINLN